MNVRVDEHPLLELKLLTCVFPEGLAGSIDDSVKKYFDAETEAPVRAGDRRACRSFLSPQPFLEPH